jgi:uncharacterized membrane protein (DUF2068 family)
LAVLKRNFPAAMNPSAASRTIALLEGAKGALVLLAGLGLLELLHRDVQAVAEALVRDAHLNPASHIPRIFIEASGKVDDHRLVLLALGALTYAIVRLAEAFGLWHEQAWAQWFGALSGGLYLPFEVRLLVRRFTVLRLFVLTCNLAIVGYLVWRILLRRREHSVALPRMSDPSHANE